MHGRSHTENICFACCLKKRISKHITEKNYANTNYDIAAKYGLETKEILAKAKQMGIGAAKVPSSSLDKITAEWLEEQLCKDHPGLATPSLALKSVPAGTKGDEPINFTHSALPVAENASLGESLPPSKPQITITVTGTEIHRLFEQILNREILLRLNVAESEKSEPLIINLARDGSEDPVDAKSKNGLATRIEIDERTRDKPQRIGVVCRMGVAL